jgi:hypothetical protein
VYSYGIVLWEILTRDEPFSEYQSFDKFKEAICIRHVRPEIPADCEPSLRALMESCWHPDPSKRPSFKEIIERLDDVVIDCAIRDENARQFWRINNFVKKVLVNISFFTMKEETLWTEFIEAFVKFVGVPDNEDKSLNIACLRAILSEELCCVC